MQGAESSAARKSLLYSVLLSAGALSALALAASRLPGFGGKFVAVSLLGFVLAVVPLTILAGRRLDAPRFGAANGVTLLRLALTAMLAALLLVPGNDAAAWLCIAVATAVLLLDGVDGRLARRLRAQSRFGARFDMEVDALLILVLAVLVWHFGRAGIWVLSAGVLRYLFVAAAYLAPWMAAPLPVSVRRKAVCIAQSTTLLVCLAPIVPAPVAPWIAGAGIALLLWSFLLDTLWLHAQRRRGSAS